MDQAKFVEDSFRKFEEIWSAVLWFFEQLEKMRKVDLYLDTVQFFFPIKVICHSELLIWLWLLAVDIILFKYKVALSRTKIFIFESLIFVHILRCYVILDTFLSSPLRF